MKNILRFLKHSNLAIFLILLLLICQAYCDLSLPQYTSDILNVGLQQGGIEETVPKTISEQSMERLAIFMTDEEYKTADAGYTAADGNGIRTMKEDASSEELASAMVIPECIVYELSTSDEAGFTMEQLEQMLASGMVTKEMLAEKLGDARTTLEELNETYVDQLAVYYVTAEYESQGTDMTALRNAYLIKVGLKMLAMSLMMALISVSTGFISSRASSKIGRDLRESVYAKVMSFTGAEIEKFSTASLITRCTNDIQQIMLVTVMLLRLVMYAPIIAIGGIIKIAGTHTGMSWTIVLAVVVLAAAIGILMAIVMPKFKIMQNLVDRLNLVSREMLTGILPIRAFSREKYEEQRFDKANLDLYATQLFTNRTMAFLSPIIMLVMNGISVLIVWFGAHRVDNGLMQVGDLTAFITYSMIIVISFLIIGMINILLPRAIISADRIAEVLDTDILLTDCAEPKDGTLAAPRGEVIFENVSFAYPGSDEPAIENISFTAKPGETTAIIGSTGCGKSTLVNLIPRFYDVTSGRILVDGIDVRELSQKKLRDLIGYVPQKGVLFSGTVESNLKYAGDGVTDDDMYEAAQIAQAEEFILAKPEGYDGAIAQGGSNVSGGQKQRLSIARAVAKHPKIFIFDDSFSALDYKTDLTLRKALAEKTGDATVIIVAQRISTILHADNIIVLDDGKITGIGTHEELLSSCGTYREIAESQLSEAELAPYRKGEK